MKNNIPNMELQRITNLIEKTFDGPALWHGPAVMEALKDVSIEAASKRISGSHSIAELVLHMTTWRTFVTKRLSGDNSYEVTDVDNFPTAADWNIALNKLKESQKQLLAALKSFPEDKLFTTVPTRTYDFYTMLHGIAQHDIYHTGQIILLRK